MVTGSKYRRWHYGSEAYTGGFNGEIYEFCFLVIKSGELTGNSPEAFSKF
jgi:hypothetical protein